MTKHIKASEVRGVAKTSFRFTKAFRLALQHQSQAETKKTGQFTSANQLLVRAALKGNPELRRRFKEYAAAAEAGDER